MLRCSIENPRLINIIGGLFSGARQKLNWPKKEKSQNSKEQATVFSDPYQACVINYSLLSHLVRRKRCLD